MIAQPTGPIIGTPLLVLRFDGTCRRSRRNGAGTTGFWTLRRCPADRDEAHGRGHDEVRIRVASDENEPGAAIGYGEIGRLPAMVVDVLR